MEIKLAEALLRRKELAEKVKVLSQFKNVNIAYQIVGQRQKINDSLDEFNGTFPKLDASQVTAEYDWHARQLRLIDAAIQQANWTTAITIDKDTMGDFKATK